MRVNNDKATVTVVINVPRELYNDYLKTLKERSLKTQSHNAGIFIEAVKKDMKDHSKK